MLGNERRSLTEKQFGYLGGILDADGSIIVTRNKGESFYVRVVFYNNSFEIIEYLIDLIGEETSIYKNDRSGKIEYHLIVKNGTRLWLLENVELIFKEPKRILAIEMIKAQMNKETERYSYLTDEWERLIGRQLTRRS